MKTTTTRRFITAALSCVALVITLVSPSSSQGQGTIGIYGTVTDINRSGAQTIGNQLRNGDTSSFLTNNSSVSISQILNNGGVGNVLVYAIALTRSTTFTLSQVGWSDTNKYAGASSGTFGDLGLTYDIFGIGIYYGSDGIPGNADDVIYTTGNANSLVNAIYGIGTGITFDVNGTVASTLAAWKPLLPETDTVSYSLGQLSTTMNANIVNPVPEPSTLVLAGIGGLTILIASQRRKSFRK
ncbi:MAG: PEP-CTERM sorting domain-containing protein [Patescibacteria group bacterium]